MSVTITWFGQVNEITSQRFRKTPESSIWQILGSLIVENHPIPTVIIKKESQQTVQENFPTVRISRPEDVGEVDSDTTPYLYIFDDPNDVADFVGNSLVGKEEATIEIIHFIPIYQTDCEIPTDLYINHLQSYGGSYVTYDSSFRFDYSLPQNVQGADACEQATIAIAQ